MTSTAVVQVQAEHGQTGAGYVDCRFEGLGHFGTFEDPDRISARALHCLGDAGGRSDMIMPSRQPFLHSRL